MVKLYDQSMTAAPQDRLQADAKGNLPISKCLVENIFSNLLGNPLYGV